MKKKLILCTTLLLAIIGCKKEKMDSKPLTSSSEIVSVGNGPIEHISGVSAGNGMLRFNSLAIFQSVYENMNNDYENSLNDTISPEDTVFTKFESNYSYISARQQVKALRIAWLDNEELNFDLDPSNNYVKSPVLKTLLNKNSACKIGNSIYLFIENYGLIEITDGNLDTYLSVVDGTRTGTNIIFHSLNGEAYIGGLGQKPSSDCKLFGSKTESSTFAQGSRKLTTKIWVRNWALFSEMGGESECFRKKSNGKWDCETANNITVGVIGSRRNGDCSIKGAINSVKSKNNKHCVSENFVFWGELNKYFKSGFGGSGQANDNGGTGATSVILN